MQRFIFGIAAILTAVVPLLSQSQSLPKPSFEVASVKLNTTRGPSYLLWPTGRFVALNMTVRGLLAFAYRTPDRPALMAEQILGGPGWIDTDRFNIEGKPEGGASKDEMQVMVQSLLEDRFQLKLHYETRELPVFNLLLASPKLKLSADQTSPTQPPDRGTLSMTGSSSGTTIKGNAVPISALIDMLHTAAGRPVLDKTGLKGLFDINLLFSQSGPTAATPAGVSETPLASDPSGPSILSAIQELGLKLESAKAPIEVLVIDSVQKPTEN